MFRIYRKVTMFNASPLLVGKAKTLDGARRSRDRRDCEYGSYVHYIVMPDGTTRPF